MSIPETDDLKDISFVPESPGKEPGIRIRDLSSTTGSNPSFIIAILFQFMCRARSRALLKDNCHRIFVLETVFITKTLLGNDLNNAVSHCGSGT